MTLKTVKLPLFKRSVVIANKKHALKNSGCVSLRDFDAITYQKKVLCSYILEKAQLWNPSHTKPCI